MDTIPTIALAQIMSELNMGDSQNLGKALHHGSEKNDTRSNLCAFLSGTFKGAHGLMAAMVDSRSIIVGPRAIDYFIPGSSVNGRDWHFVVPQSPHCIARMLLALETCGVRWNSLLDSFINLGIDRDEDIMTITHWNIEDVDKDVFRQTLESRLWSLGYAPDSGRSKELHGLLHTLWKIQGEVIGSGISGLIHISFKRGHGIRMMGTESETSDMHHILYLKGFMVASGRMGEDVSSPKVHVLVNKNRNDHLTAMDIIKRMPSSHLMCFVSPFCAVHLFYDMAKSYKSIRFSNSPDATQQFVMNEYREKGWEFVPVSEPMLQPRSLQDGSACIVYFDDTVKDLRFVLSFAPRHHEYDRTKLTIMANMISRYKSSWQDVSWTISSASGFIYKCTNTNYNIKVEGGINRDYYAICPMRHTYSHMLAVNASALTVNVKREFIDKFEDAGRCSGYMDNIFRRIFGRYDMPLCS